MAARNGVRRSNSLSWRVEAGLPPTPSEIDGYADLHRYMDDAGAATPFDLAPRAAVTKHPKLKLRILLARHSFEAGSTLTGVLEVTSSTSQRLRLGEIAVELEAFEELLSRDHSATQIFLFSRTLFQGEHLPPSNAVLPAAPLQGFWTARKGRTTFPFSFPLPLDAPSSLTFGGNAKLQYGIKGLVQTWWNDSRSVVNVRTEVPVVERWQDEWHPRYREPIEVLADTHIFMGGNGAVWLEAALAERLFVAGDLLSLRVGVKNHSKRQVSGIKVCLVRKLIFPVHDPTNAPATRPNLEPQIVEEAHVQHFKGQPYDFPPDKEAVVNVAMGIPRDLYTLRKTRLFEVQLFAVVCLQLGSFAKDLTVEMPIFVAHPGSLAARPPRPVDPLQNLPQRSRSAMGQHGQHQAWPSPPPMMATMPDPWQAMAPPSRPLSAAATLVGSPQPIWQNRAALASPSSPVPHWPTTDAMVPQPWHGQASPSPVQLNSASQALPIIPRSQSAGPEMLRAMPPIQTLRSAPLRQRRDSSPAEPILALTPDNLPAQTHGKSNADSPHPSALISPHDIPHAAGSSLPIVLSPSQILGADGQPLGLATIEEDGESAAGTIRVKRHTIGSVTHRDIVQFEQMVDEDGPMLHAALHAVGLVPEAPTEPHHLRQDESARDKSLPPAPRVDQSRPAASFVFEQGAGVRAPHRPSSAQGVGLQALESRLSTPLPQVTPAKEEAEPQSSTPSSRPDPPATPNPTRRRTSSDSNSFLEVNGIEVNSFVAAERQRRVREDEQQRIEEQERLRAASERRQARQSAILMAATATKSKASHGTATTKSPNGGERKIIDEEEQRQLHRQAVGRVTGWLSTSPSSQGIQTNDGEDPALTPKTPSPSLLIGKASTTKSTKKEDEVNGSPSAREKIRSVAELLQEQEGSTSAQQPDAPTNSGSHYDVRSARGGRGGRVASVASMWASIAEGTDGGPGRDATVVLTLKPKALRGSTATALDFTAFRKGMQVSLVEATKIEVSLADKEAAKDEEKKPSFFVQPVHKALAHVPRRRPLLVQNGVHPPHTKGVRAAHFLNTTVPKAILVTADTATKSTGVDGAVMGTASTPSTAAVPRPVRELLALHEAKAATKPTQPSTEEGKLRRSRRITSDLIALEARGQVQHLRPQGKENKAVDVDHVDAPMGGRGTTKPIGQERLANLRSLWSK